mmetsp:Transcript_45227/g.103250  ORF Transcript_45227/g.103250 Transcript_45227/m.103250 type:complete len:202 (-) Transcript_45227:234-839(-)
MGASHSSTLGPKLAIALPTAPRSKSDRYWPSLPLFSQNSMVVIALDRIQIWNVKKSRQQKHQESGQGFAEQEHEHAPEWSVDLNCLLHRLNHGDGHGGNGNQGVKDHKEEKLVIAKPHAVVDPGAMVIHAQHAGLAHSAMMAAVWLVLAAPFAESSGSGALGLHRGGCHRGCPRLHLRIALPLRGVRDSPSTGRYSSVVGQ